jgi:outer membrane protein
VARTERLLVVIALAGVALLLVSSPQQAYAQARVAYVASEAILDRLPDAKVVRTKLSELQTGWLREIARQEGEVARVRADMQTNRLLWSAQEKRDAEARLADLESKLAAFRSAKFGPKGEYEKSQQEMMGPVVERVAKAIEEEGRSQKFDYVLDKSNRGLGILYANPSYDLTIAVLKRLGVDVTDIPAPPIPTSDPASEQNARRNRTRRDVPVNEEVPKDPNQVLQPPPVDPLPPSGETNDPN